MKYAIVIYAGSQRRCLSEVSEEGEGWVDNRGYRVSIEKFLTQEEWEQLHAHLTRNADYLYSAASKYLSKKMPAAVRVVMQKIKEIYYFQYNEDPSDARYFAGAVKVMCEDCEFAEGVVKKGVDTGFVVHYAFCKLKNEEAEVTSYLHGCYAGKKKKE